MKHIRPAILVPAAQCRSKQHRKDTHGHRGNAPRVHKRSRREVRPVVDLVVRQTRLAIATRTRQFRENRLGCDRAHTARPSELDRTWGQAAVRVREPWSGTPDQTLPNPIGPAANRFAFRVLGAEKMAAVGDGNIRPAISTTTRPRANSTTPGDSLHVWRSLGDAVSRARRPGRGARHRDHISHTEALSAPTTAHRAHLGRLSGLHAPGHRLANARSRGRASRTRYDECWFGCGVEPSHGSPEASCALSGACSALM